MSRLTITGNILAKADKVERVKSELLKLIETTRNETGCIQYDLHQDNENPAYFMFYENWESRDLWQIHMNAPHLAAYMAATDGAVEKFWVHELSQIA